MRTVGWAPAPPQRLAPPRSPHATAFPLPLREAAGDSRTDAAPARASLPQSRGVSRWACRSGLIRELSCAPRGDRQCECRRHMRARPSMCMRGMAAERVGERGRSHRARRRRARASASAARGVQGRSQPRRRMLCISGARAPAFALHVIIISTPTSIAQSPERQPKWLEEHADESQRDEALAKR